MTETEFQKKIDEKDILVEKVLWKMADFVEKAGEQKKADTKAKIWYVLIPWVAAIIISIFYFMADYEIYPDMNQQQMMSETGQMQQQQ